jgi:hypothetical protein
MMRFVDCPLVRLGAEFCHVLSVEPPLLRPRAEIYTMMRLVGSTLLRPRAEFNYDEVSRLSSIEAGSRV